VSADGIGTATRGLSVSRERIRRRGAPADARTRGVQQFTERVRVVYTAAPV
jgi:hypothetical protein